MLRRLTFSLDVKVLLFQSTTHMRARDHKHSKTHTHTHTLTNSAWTPWPHLISLPPYHHCFISKPKSQNHSPWSHLPLAPPPRPLPWRRWQRQPSPLTGQPLASSRSGSTRCGRSTTRLSKWRSHSLTGGS